MSLGNRLSGHAYSQVSQGTHDGNTISHARLSHQFHLHFFGFGMSVGKHCFRSLAWDWYDIIHRISIDGNRRQ
jgi:hypothetical protein